MVLTRERIRDGWVQKMIMQGGDDVRALTEQELLESRRAILGHHPPGEDLWLFGYGSLIWNPCFEFVQRRIGRALGYHRQFCLWTHLGRGTTECPGLMLGLERGGSCVGVAFRIAADVIDTELDIIWRREMVTAAYQPSWVALDLAGERCRAVAFLINRTHDRYARGLSEAAIADAIAIASGPLGPCSDYLFNTVTHLRTLGIADKRLERIADAVRRRQLAAPRAATGPTSPAAETVA
jgi:cation transport protein ChaC